MKSHVRSIVSAVLLMAASCIPDDPGGKAAGGGAPAGTGGSGGSAPSGGSGGATGGIAGSGGGTGGGRRADAGPRPDGGPRSDVARRPDAARAPDTGARPDTSAAARFTCPEGPFPAPMLGPSQAVCGGYAFEYNHNEGPTWLAAQGAFFFTHFPVGAPARGDIVKYTPGGACEVWKREVGCNGLAVAPDGALLAACHQSRSVVRFDPVTGEARTLATEYMGQLLDTPNDLVAHSNGSIYFTNPPFELGNRPRGVGPGVFRIDPAGALERVYQGGPPNGIALSPDERQLYALNGGIWDVDESGVASNRRGLFTGGDGMAVDCAGNLYARGVIFDREGQNIGNYGSGTNLAFGGPDGRSMFIVGPGRNARVVQTNVPGLP
jgi:gluconolactonase